MFDKSTFANHINNANNRNKMDAGVKTPFSVNESVLPPFLGGRNRGEEPKPPHQEFENLMHSINSYMNHPPYRSAFTEHMKANPDAHPRDAHQVGITGLQNHLYATRSREQDV
tara:strand:+ start:558 stop:896 length:339 start_codon:yes stop_codon:yes gene_type:complete